MKFEEFYKNISDCFLDVAPIFVDDDLSRASFYHVKVQDDRIGNDVMHEMRLRGLVLCGINVGVNPSGSRFLRLSFDNKLNN